MTDTEYEKQRDRIQALEKKWFTVLGLDRWGITVKYNRDSVMKVNGDYCEQTAGRASVMWQYMSATLEFNLQKAADNSDEKLENVFVHECCHVLVHEMREWCQTQNLEIERSSASMLHEDRVVCMLARAFINAREAGARDACIAHSSSGGLSTAPQ